jgi:hypothetical protein
MPKVNYTSSKGLFQENGSSIELSRSGANVTLKRQVIAITNAASVDRTLKLTESAALITLSPATNTNTIKLTLPRISAAAGVWYDFVIIADQGNAAADITIQTGHNDDNITGAIIGNGTGNVNVAPFAITASRLVFDGTASTSVKHTRLRLLCDGNFWIIRGVADIAAGLITGAVDGTQHIATENNIA